MCCLTNTASADTTPPVSKKTLSTKIEIKDIPSSKWIRISEEKPPNKQFTHISYLPVTNEFLTWGRAKFHRYDAVRYDVEILKLSESRPEWKDSLPTGKEASWANGMFPDWSCKCHRSKSKKRTRPWSNEVFDCTVGSFAQPNIVKFCKIDDVHRPTRSSVFNQVCYDNKRNHLFYFVGGKTFTYDPVNKLWSDLKIAPPITCETLVWASLCYDPIKDQVILFGGGQALNPWGGAKTWVFDYTNKSWSRPKILNDVEPPLRCNAKLIYDSKNKKMVLFGGFSQDKLLSDTWIYDPEKVQWEEKKTKIAPPPETRYGATYIEKHGVILYVFPNYSSRSGIIGGGVWTYNVTSNEWNPRLGNIPRIHTGWLGCDYSTKDDVVVLNSTNKSSKNNSTFLYRLDPKSIDTNPKRKKSPESFFRWYNSKQQTSLLSTPEPTPLKTATIIKSLPSNKLINTEFPGHVFTRCDYGTMTIDTDRSVVVYHGGGHSAYGGNDFLRYSIKNNRWTSKNAYFCPFLDGASVTVYGWSYGMRPFIQHTYRWYAYDPVSKMVVYCTRGMSAMDGKTVMLDNDPKNAFKFDFKKHGALTWVYDAKTDKMYPPVLGRPFNFMAGQINLIGTPKGIFAKSNKKLYHAKVKLIDGKAEIIWTLLDETWPKVSVKKNRREFQPLTYDSKRERLLRILLNDKSEIQIYEHPLGKGTWKNINCKGGKDLNRDVIYDVENDCLMTMIKNKIWIMDCKTNIWRELQIDVPKDGTNQVRLVYDIKNKLCIIVGDNRRWLKAFYFRFNPATAKYKNNQIEKK